MSRYHFRAAAGDGRVLSGTLNAASLPEADDMLFGRGLHPIAIIDIEGAPSARRKLPSRDLIAAMRSVATLVSVGVPVERALATTAKLPLAARLRQALEESRRLLAEGRTLSTALPEAGVALSPSLVGLLRAGERGSRLGPALEELATQLEGDGELRDRIRQALAYPAVLLLAGMASVAVIAGLIVPRFAEILVDLGQGLPTTTRLLLSTSALLREHGVLLLVAAAVLGFLARRWHARATVALLLRGLIEYPDGRGCGCVYGAQVAARRAAMSAEWERVESGQCDREAMAILPSARRSLVLPADPIIIAESPAMRRAVDLARRFAASSMPILLVGPTGTGKEVLAQAIHRWSRPNRPLIDIDCGTLHPETAVNELFGHRKGSYTGAVEDAPGLLEAADGGTIFFDELGSLPTRAQAMLLRALETGEVRRVGEQRRRRIELRLIAAIQGNAPDISGIGRVRADLYQRLAGGIIQLRPLADRPEDLFAMAHYFAGLHGRTLGRDAAVILRSYGWPGNVRELRHVLDRAAVLQEVGTLTGRTLREAIELGDTEGSGADAAGRLALLLGRTQLEELCLRHRGMAWEIQAELGVARATLYRRLEQTGLRLKDFREPARAGNRLTPR